MEGWGITAARTFPTTQPAASAVLFPLLWLSLSRWLLHIVQKEHTMWSSECVLPISELCCFITFQKRCKFYNPAHSIRDSDVAMPTAESVFTIHDIFTTRSRGR